MLNNIAPWETPNLPAPAATIERPIEGRARRFALWFWDGRLVWRDLDHPKLWWASLDYAEGDAAKAWDKAVEAGRFGRASSQERKIEGYGPLLNLPRRVRFRPVQHGRICKFHLISDSNGRGIARQSEEVEWWLFPAATDTRPLKRVQQGTKKQPLWWPGLQIPKSGNVVWSGYSERFLSQLPPHFVRVLRAADNAEILLLARDLYVWHYFLSGSHPDFQFMQEVVVKLPPLFGLPPETRMLAHVTTWPFRKEELGVSCTFGFNGINWRVQRFEDWPHQPFTADEILELELRLRESLRPILTPTEIEEILRAPARP